MGFFGAKPRPSAPSPRPRPANPARPTKARGAGASLTILAAGNPAIDPNRLQAALELIAPGEAAVGGIIGLPAPIGGGDQPSAYSVTIRGTRIDCLGVDAPAPGLDEMIQSSRCDHATLEPLKGHGGHIVCLAREATDGREATIALFQAAAAHIEQGAIGIIHTPAWQCFLAENLAAMIDPETLTQMHEGMDKLVWCNLIPFHGEGGSWWTTKGNHVFGVPDFTLWDDGRLEPGAARNSLLYLFDYVRKGAVLKPGELLAIGDDLFLRAGPVTEFHEYLQGPGDTLALRFQ